MSSLPASIVRELVSSIESAGLGILKSQIVSSAQECFRLEFNGRDYYRSLGSTRFGGYPDLPSESNWPTLKEYKGDFKSGIFLCQINFAELPDSYNNSFPNSGLLYLFWMDYANGMKSIESKFVDNVDAQNLKTSHPKVGYWDLEEFKPNKATISLGVDISGAREKFYDYVGKQVEERQLDEEKELKLQSLFGKVGVKTELRSIPFAKLGGFPYAYEEDLKLRAVISNSDYDGDFWSFRRLKDRLIKGVSKSELSDKELKNAEWIIENHRQINELKKEWTLLISIGSNDEMGFYIGDWNSIFVLIRKEDLAAKKFSRLFAFFEQG